MTDTVPMAHPKLWGLTSYNFMMQTQTFHPIPFNWILRTLDGIHHWLQRPKLSWLERKELDAYTAGRDSARKYYWR
jgi:hypothetical protein